MAENSKIEWTDRTWNPVAGCTWASPGCDHCYAAKMTRRLEAMGQSAYSGLTTRKHFNGEIRTLPDKLTDPLLWKKPRRVFVNSMSDLFHKDVPAAFVADVFATAYEAQWHTFQILTKRAERMADIMLNSRLPWAVAAIVWRRLSETNPEKAAVLTPAEITQDVMDNWPLRNVWLGVSVEDQERADDRIPHLLKTPATVRFLSVEPLIGRVNLVDSIGRAMLAELGLKTTVGVRSFSGRWPIDWVIVGGESGHGARPCEAAWVRAIKSQCAAAAVPCFVKQMGAYVVDRNDAGFEAEMWTIAEGPDAGQPVEINAWPSPVDVEHDLGGTRDGYQGAPVRVHLKNKKGGDWNEWPADLRVRQFPNPV